MTTEKEQKPAWKQFEDEQLRKRKIEEEKGTIILLKNWLSINAFNFIEYNTENEILSIPIDVSKLISRKEISKLLEITDGKLGIQIYQQQIQIYRLHTKAPDHHNLKYQRKTEPNGL